MAALVRSQQSEHREVDDLSARVAGLERVLSERAADVARLKVELHAFRIDYRLKVGRLHEELDDLEAAIAAAELGEIARRLEDDAPSPGAEHGTVQAEALPRYTSDAVRKLFRDVARAIHPDLAEDDAARQRRHALMIEANRAYAVGDEERLRFILAAWEKSPEAVQGSDADATRLRLVRRVAQLEQAIALFDGDFDALQDSPMGKLKAMVDEAASRGKDLVADMVARLKVDIMIARNRLHAIEWTP